MKLDFCVSHNYTQRGPDVNCQLRGFDDDVDVVENTPTNIVYYYYYGCCTTSGPKGGLIYMYDTSKRLSMPLLDNFSP
jgi:hypothetical protein